MRQGFVRDGQLLEEQSIAKMQGELFLLVLAFADMSMQSTHTYDCRTRKIRCCLSRMFLTAAAYSLHCSDCCDPGDDRLGTQDSLGSEAFEIVHI